MIATGCFGSAQIFDMKTFTKVTTLVEENEVGGTHILSLSFSPDGKHLAIGTTSRGISIWDIAGNLIIRKLSGHRTEVMAVQFSPCGNFIASGTKDGEAKLWDLLNDSRTVELVLPEIDSVKSMTFSSDGRFIAAGTDAYHVVLWNAKDGSLINCFLGHTSFVQSVAFSPNGLQLVSGDFEGSVRLWKLNLTTSSAVNGRTRQKIQSDISSNGTYSFCRLELGRQMDNFGG